jgi:probable rRNA maturation factor
MTGRCPTASIDFRGFPVRFRRLKTRFERTVREVLEDHRVKSYAMSISFVDDCKIADLNRERLGRSGPTDVIAFDLSEPGLPFERVGDIYVSTDRALENSVRFRVAPEEELLRLVVHGVLHVLGYADRKPAEARKMKAVQEKMVENFQLLAGSDEE